MPFWFSSVIAILIATLGIPLILAYRIISKSTFLCDQIEHQASDTVPEYVSQYFADAIAKFATHQFRLVGYYKIETIQDEVHWCIFLQDQSQKVQVTVVIGDLLVTATPQIFLSTIFADNSRLLTMNLRETYRFLKEPEYFLQYYEMEDIDGLLKHHSHRMTELSKMQSIQILTTESYIPIYKSVITREANYLVRRGIA